MTKEEAINSFKKSNEQTKLNIQVHSHIMDTSEIRELEWYIERDKMAIEALEQEPKTGHWIVVPGMNEQCSKCGKFFPLSYFKGRPFEINYCPNCGAKMEG